MCLHTVRKVRLQRTAAAAEHMCRPKHAMMAATSPSHKTCCRPHNGCEGLQPLHSSVKLTGGHQLFSAGMHTCAFCHVTVTLTRALLQRVNELITLTLQLIVRIAATPARACTLPLSSLRKQHRSRANKAMKLATNASGSARLQLNMKIGRK